MSRLGWVKDPRDERDFLHLTSKILPIEVSLEKSLASVRQQGGQNSCVGFGIGGCLTSLFNQLGTYTEWISPRWIYNGARQTEDTLQQDVGVYPRDGFDYLHNNGYLLEHFWVYVDSPLDKNPASILQLSQAVKEPEVTYYRCVDGKEGVMSALADGNFVSFGSPWADVWMGNPGSNIIPMINSDMRIGCGHEIFMYGYNTEQMVFYCQNSWGENWGVNGRFKMPMEALDVFKQSFNGYDAQYIIMSPTPTPTPTPSTCKWGNGIANALNKIQEIRKRQGRFYYLNPLK